MRLALAALMVCASSSLALAEAPEEPGAVYTKETWPAALIERPLTLGTGMIEIRGDVFIDMSEGFVGKPFALRPGVFYGVSDTLTVGVVHPGLGLCLAGAENGCAKLYDDVGVDALFALTPLVAAHGSVNATAFSPDVLVNVRVGVLGSYVVGRGAVLLDPSLQIGLTSRAVNEEVITVPLEVQLQATPELAAFLAAGIAGPFDGFGDAFTVPVGAGALLNLSKHLDAGLRFTFVNLAGKGGTADVRVIDLLVNVRL